MNIDSFKAFKSFIIRAVASITGSGRVSGQTASRSDASAEMADAALADDLLAAKRHAADLVGEALRNCARRLEAADLAPDARHACADELRKSADALLSIAAEACCPSCEGNESLPNATCNVRKLMHETLAVFNALVGEKGVRVSLETPRDLPVFALREDYVRQILFLLTDNAVGSTLRGRVTVSALFEPDSRTLVLRVADTGMGIPLVKIATLFDPPKNEERISGLPLVRCLARKLGGLVTVESAIGKGSHFTVRIPSVAVVQGPVADTQAEEEAAAFRPGDAAAYDPQDLRVFVVDDVAMNILIVRSYVQQAGIPPAHVSSFTSAADALSAIEDCMRREGLPILVFTDLWMPRTTGEDLARGIRGLEKSGLAPSYVRICAITADSECGTKFDMSLFDQVLHKPVTGAQIAKMI